MYKLPKNHKRVIEFFLLHGKAKNKFEIAECTPHKSRTYTEIQKMMKKKLIITDDDGFLILNKELCKQQGYDLEPLTNRAEDEMKKIPDIDLLKGNLDGFIPSDAFMKEVCQKINGAQEYLKRKKQSIPRK